MSTGLNSTQSVPTYSCFSSCSCDFTRDRASRSRDQASLPNRTYSGVVGTVFKGRHSSPLQVAGSSAAYLYIYSVPHEKRIPVICPPTNDPGDLIRSFCAKSCIYEVFALPCVTNESGSNANKTLINTAVPLFN